MQYKFNQLLPYFIEAIEIIIIIVLTKITIDLSSSLIDKTYNKTQKEDIIKSPWIELLKSLIKYAALITAVMFILNVCGVDFKKIYEFFNAKNEGVLKLVKITIKIIIIFIITSISIKILNEIISGFFDKQKNIKFGINGRKADTLSELFKNVIRYILFFIAVVMSFDAAGIDIRTFIAVTSVAGVAIGLGAQSLIKDVISGFFILFEDQFAVGDFITIGNMSGIVETVGLRITKVRDFSGDLYIIPNGSIDKVTNKSRGNMRALVDVVIAYEENIDNAISILNDVCKNIKKDFDYIVSGPDILGVIKIGEDGTTIRIIAQTLSMKQWNVESELRKRIKYAFDKEGIMVAYQRRVIINYEEGENDK